MELDFCFPCQGPLVHDEFRRAARPGGVVDLFKGPARQQDSPRQPGWTLGLSPLRRPSPAASTWPSTAGSSITIDACKHGLVSPLPSSLTERAVRQLNPTGAGTRGPGRHGALLHRAARAGGYPPRCCLRHCRAHRHPRPQAVRSALARYRDLEAKTHRASGSIERLADALLSQEKDRLRRQWGEAPKPPSISTSWTCSRRASRWSGGSSGTETRSFGIAAIDHQVTGRR